MARKSSANRGKRWPAPAFRLSDWFSDHRRAIAETFEFVSLRLGSSLFVWLLVGIALALPAALYLAQQNFLALDDGWQGQPGLTVYFTVGTESDNVAAVQAQLQQCGGA